MRILFLCGSLEPGKDGVGDYTRRLAAELIRQKFDCVMLALSDHHVAESLTESQEDHHLSINVLRLASSEPWGTRLSRARPWIESFSPDWVSLQFVPYAFQRKGLPLGLGSRLKQMAGEARWHVMFHELWIGMEETAPFRQRLVGALQRQLIRQIIERLGPEEISTQSELYIAQLRILGYQARHIPLFGNIPKYHIGDEATHTVESAIKLVHFGGIQKRVPIADFAREFAEFGKASGRIVSLTIAGRSGPELERWEKAWLAEGIKVEVTGECSPNELSRLFQKASFGIATTPLAQIEKSGSAAAMLEHSLPVINVAARWIPRGGLRGGLPDGICVYRPSKLAEVVSKWERASVSGPSVQAVALQLSDMLRRSR